MFSALSLQDKDGFGDDGHAVGTDAGSAEDLPGLQPCHAAFGRCPGCGQGPVGGALGEGEFAARWAFESGGGPGADTLVDAVGEDRDALAFAHPDDAVGAGRGQVVGATRQRGWDLTGPHRRDR